MIANPSQPYITPEEYLEMEKHSQIKHEYEDGKIYPLYRDFQGQMAGASDPHVTISANWIGLLRTHLRGSGCRAYIADMKVQVQSINRYYYPDVFVTCDERDRSSLYSKSYPTLIIEVLSPSTAAFDRGRKFANYRRLETLQEYVLVDTEQVAIECFRRDLAGNWLFHAYGEGDEVHLASVNFKCAIALIYEDTLPLPTSQEL